MLAPNTLPDEPWTPGVHDRVRVLCVDDEPLVLGGLSRTLRPTCEVRTAVGGRAGIEALVADPEIAVVISDLAMPDLDGTTFLACVRRVAPYAMRILLTGQADVQSAIDAINNGEVFRFLLKPISPDLLRSTVVDAARHRSALQAQRALLEEIIPTSVASFVQNLLQHVHPAAFARAMRLKSLVVAIGPRLAIAHRWPVEVAAMLSQLGLLAVPQSLAERVCSGRPLTPDEEHTVRTASLLPEQMIAGIPSLESVRYILRHAVQPRPVADEGADPAAVLGARLLRFALAYDEMASQGMSRTSILNALSTSFKTSSDDPLLTALCAHMERPNPENDPATVEQPDGVASTVSDVSHVRTIALSEVEVGMVFAANVTTDADLILVAGGQEVTPALAERIRTSWRGFAGATRVRVFVPDGTASNRGTAAS